MQLKLGEKIRSLRRRNGRTQEALADALGVSAQAVSRWEMNGAYPDMELIPAIANYFNVTLDELFGYEGERNRKIDDLIVRVNELDVLNLRSDQTIDNCISLLRNGLAEFPGNERIMHRMALLLSEAGWHRQKDWVNYGEDGYIRYSFDRCKQNIYWAEAIELFKSLVDGGCDHEMVTDSICNLILLYRNTGENDKAISLAERLPTVDRCREVMLASATDGKIQSLYLGTALLKLAHTFSEQFVYALVNQKENYETDLPIEKIKGIIFLFGLICEDGNLGEYHCVVCDLYLYLSRLQWERGYHDEAFLSLDEALHHARAFDRLAGADNVYFTAPFVSLIKCDTKRWNPGCKTISLPEDWPMWCNPDYSKVKKEIAADPRWTIWVEQTKAT